MTFAIWALVIGALLIAMALSGSLLRRLPLSASMLYLAAGVALGPAGLGLLRPRPLVDAHALEVMTEIAVLISLFSVGLRLGQPLSSPRWVLPLRLATVSMVLTIGLVSAAGVLGLGLPLGAAVLLGAILAPTDPVLASDVQVEEETDRDRLRFGLTGEGGMNDGAAFPFVMLGLGLLGLHDLGGGGWRWIALDLLWAVAGGLAIGAALGAAIGKLVVYLRTRHQEAVGLDEFLALGLIGVAYGLALLVRTYGFLAVFAAGLALQRMREPPSAEEAHRREPALGAASLHDRRAHEAAATSSVHAGAYMMQAVRGFNAQLERMAEVGVVLVLGAMLGEVRPGVETLWFVPLLLLVVRPVAVAIGLFGADLSRQQRWLISWFGIRGVGSVYYLMYAIQHGVPAPLAGVLVPLTLATVGVSIVVHGVSVTPLMNRYARSRARRTGAA
jgi:NhaP-type Na+/H+ or K+/H+ antiporter